MDAGINDSLVESLQETKPGHIVSAESSMGIAVGKGRIDNFLNAISELCTSIN